MEKLCLVVAYGFERPVVSSLAFVWCCSVVSKDIYRKQRKKNTPTAFQVDFQWIFQSEEVRESTVCRLWRERMNASYDMKVAFCVCVRVFIFNSLGVNTLLLISQREKIISLLSRYNLKRWFIISCLWSYPCTLRCCDHGCMGERGYIDQNISVPFDSYVMVSSGNGVVKLLH